MENFGVTLVSILENAGNNHHRLVVPEFQRLYKWPAAKAEQMFKMFWDAAQREQRVPVYLGSIILASRPPNEKLIVDGQQRISTFVLLLAACRYIFINLRKEAPDSWKEKVNPLFKVTYWGREFADEDDDDASRPIFLMNTREQDQWTALFDRTGNPIHPRVDEVTEAHVGKYMVNYQSLCTELRGKIAQSGGPQDQRRALARFGEYISGFVRILLADVPNLAIAYEVFRIANIPGEPLDVASIVRHRLAAGPDGMDEHELNDPFSRATPGTDPIKDELVIKTVLTVLLPDSDVDTVLREMIGGGNFPDVPSLTPRMTRRRFCRYLSLHADLEVLNQPIHDRTPHVFHEAVQKLFQFENACTRRNGDDEMVVTDERDFLCWRSVAIKVLSNLNVHVRLPKVDLTSVACMEGGQANIENARSAFIALERLLLCYSLPVHGIQNSKLFAIMAEAVKKTTFEDIMELITPSPDLILSAISALDKPLYNKGRRTVSAMRYLLGQVNVLWHIHEDRVPGLIPQAEDLRFNTDWTTEHIYAQGADEALAPRSHTWFNDRKFSRIHCLGNLLPLHPALQQRANNEAFIIKRETYRTSSNVLSRAASDVIGFQKAATTQQRATFEKEVTFLPQRFIQRHERIKALIARHIFGRDAGVSSTTFNVEPLPEVNDEGNVIALTPPSDADSMEPPNRQRPRLDFSPQLPPQLPPHFRTGRAKITKAAYTTSLLWIKNESERMSVKSAVDKLASAALAAAPNDICVQRYLKFAGDHIDIGNSRHIICTRRIDIVSRFVRGIVTLHELEGSFETSVTRRESTYSMRFHMGNTNSVIEGAGGDAVIVTRHDKGRFAESSSILFSPRSEGKKVHDENPDTNVFLRSWNAFKNSEFSNEKLNSAIQALQAAIDAAGNNHDVYVKYQTMMNQIVVARANSMSKSDGGRALRELTFK